MATISDLLQGGRTLSVEFFPPKTAEGRAQLEGALGELAALDLSFVSVTYGAGGSSREVTREIVLDIDARHAFPAMPHLTCIGHRRAELDELLSSYVAAGVRNVLALAGDPPADGSPAEGDFQFASELVELVKAHGDLSVGVAAFPETHPRSADRAHDRKHLAAKLEAADFGITQFFFDVEHYARMVDELAELGCTKPILPGIMPLTNPTSIRRFADMNGAAFPDELGARIEAAEASERHRIVVDHAAELCQAVLEVGAPGLHFYTLNRSQVTVDVVRELDFRAVPG